MQHVGYVVDNATRQVVFRSIAVDDRATAQAMADLSWVHISRARYSVHVVPDDPGKEYVQGWRWCP